MFASSHHPLNLDLKAFRFVFFGASALRMVDTFLLPFLSSAPPCSLQPLWKKSLREPCKLNKGYVRLRCSLCFVEFVRLHIVLTPPPPHQWLALAVFSIRVDGFVLYFAFVQITDYMVGNIVKKKQVTRDARTRYLPVLCLPFNIGCCCISRLIFHGSFLAVEQCSCASLLTLPPTRMKMNMKNTM